MPPRLFLACFALPVSQENPQLLALCHFLLLCLFLHLPCKRRQRIHICRHVLRFICISSPLASDDNKQLDQYIDFFSQSTEVRCCRLIEGRWCWRPLHSLAARIPQPFQMRPEQHSEHGASTPMVVMKAVSRLLRNSHTPGARQGGGSSESNSTRRELESKGREKNASNKW